MLHTSYNTHIISCSMVQELYNSVVTSLIQVTSVLLVIFYSNYHQRIGQRCLLGERVVYEKRISGHCCINGPQYERPINTTTCECSIEDFEWYGSVLVNSVSSCISFNVRTSARLLYDVKQQSYHKIIM